MHHYRRNIGDYHKKAGRLSILQHGVYNLLIDACYDRERFPTREEAIDWVWASTPEEEQAVDFILRKFFELRDGVYVQTRIEEELEEYRQFCAKQAEKGKNGGRPKKAEPLQEKPGGFSKEPSGKPAETQRAEIKTLTTNQLTTNQLTKEKHTSEAPAGTSDSSPEEKPKPTKYKFESNHLDLANRMAEPVIRRYPAQKIDPEQWADAIRKMIEIDRRQESEIMAMWIWITNHDRQGFSWAANCRTPMKLRERDGQGLPYWDVIQAQRLRENGMPRASPKPAGLHSFEGVDYSKGVNPDGSF